MDNGLNIYMIASIVHFCLEVLETVTFKYQKSGKQPNIVHNTHKNMFEPQASDLTIAPRNLFAKRSVVDRHQCQIPA